MTEDQDSDFDGDLTGSTDDFSDGRALVLRKLLEIAEEKNETKLKEIMLTQGVKSLSDLNFIDLSVVFKDIMTPVQIGRLKADVEKAVDGSSSETSAATHIIDFNAIFPKSFLVKLKGRQRLDKTERLKVIRDVGDELYATVKPVSEKLCLKVAACLEDQFKKALSASHAHSSLDLSYQIYRHCQYKSKCSKKKRQAKNAEKRVALKKFSKRQSYGIDEDSDLPVDFPEQENAASQQSKKEELLTMYNSGKVDKKKVGQLMRATYVSQRATVHEQLLAEKFLEQWPFLGKFLYMKDHFLTLMKMDGEPANNLKEFCESFLKFITKEANIKRNVKDKGKDEITLKLKAVIKQLEGLPNKTEDDLLVAVILSASIKLRAPGFFLHFDDTTSFDDIQASPTLPGHGCPIVVVLGSDLIGNSKCNVLKEKRLLDESFSNAVVAIKTAFMAYWVFKHTYPTKFAPLMEFIQTYIFKMKINCASTSKTSRTCREKTDKGWKSAPKQVNSKILTLMREYEDYCSEWDLEVSL